MAMPYLPYDLLSMQILPRLPLRALLRFRCVSKAWRDIVDDDSFARAHIRLQNFMPSMLIVAKIKEPYSARNQLDTTVSYYLWEESQGAATLVHTERDYPISISRRLWSTATHDMAHCDGLVIVPSEEHVRLLNPAMGHLCVLPWSLATEGSHGRNHFRGHQAFGLGHDPRSDKYKVVRFFYRSLHVPDDDDTAAGDYHYSLAMEVCTIGMDCLEWRETVEPPPYPIKPGRTATFFKGSLLWTVEESLLGAAAPAPGFVRFRLEDESFSVMPLPPCSPRPFDYSVSSLAVLRGELCVSHPACNYESLEMWMCGNLDCDPPQWDRRYIIPGFQIYPGRRLRPIAMFEDDIVFQDGPTYLLRYYYHRSGENAVMDRVIRMKDLRYRCPDERSKGMLVKYTREAGYDFSLIPYVPSLVTVL